ncbi:MAG: hypothetical protein U1E65_29135 [Myxococcota bacterium]
MSLAIILLLVLVLGLAALVLGPSLFRRYVITRLLDDETLKKLGSDGVAKTADTIRFVPRATPSWRDPSRVSALESSFRAEGFATVGVFDVPELPGLMLQGWVRPEEQLAGTIYDHPKAGIWFDIFTHYQDEQSLTGTNKDATGLDERPGHPVVRSVGGSLADVLGVFRAAVLPKERWVIDASNFEARFVQAYAHGVAWRKYRGVSAAEVRALAEKRL